ncbi:unnamed protein product [Mucor hiemalis]
MTSTAVRVGLRVRPLTEKEQINNCTECLSFIPNEPQILIGTDKSFTYDYVFDSNADQAQLYLNAASPLLHKFIDGFNATILAYGQTGSGKTFSMGTSLDNSVSAENEGIVPRCIIELFQILKNREQQNSEFKYEVYVSFLELYNEEFIDLLNNPQQSNNKRRSASFNSSNTNAAGTNNGTNSAPQEVSIREDVAGNIYWSGVKEELCYSPEELLGYLVQGSLGRTTGSTEMNSVSSRSHAIFSVILKQQKPETEDGKTVMKSLNSKFHFVDLAGSERLKRTHAQGDRAREGIAINSGLLALGNVISALGDETRRATHIPYRDSKLTRLLQDSLGGNSQTLMLACVSPADTNFMETLNTLKYANRARNIKNRVTVNQEFAGSSMEVNQLKALVSRLRMEIGSLRGNSSSAATTHIGSHATTNSTDPLSNQFMIEDKSLLRNEVQQLRERLQEMSAQVIQVTSERDTLIMERELGEFMQSDNCDGGDLLLENISTTTRIETHPIIEKYQKSIAELTHQLDDTKDKLQRLELVQPSLQAALAKVNAMQQSSSNNLQKFSSMNQPRKTNSSSRRRINRKGGRISANSSATTTAIGYAARIATSKIHTRRPIITKSTSTSIRNKQKKHVRIQDCRQFDDEFEDEGFVNEHQDDDVRHEEVKESIAKVRADIRKSLQVLELVKPLDDTATSWEEELKAFEAEEKRLNDISEMHRELSDEGRFSLTPSPFENSNSLHDIEILSVPTWKNDERGSNSKSGSSFEDVVDDHKILQHTITKPAAASNNYNSQLSRMLHQIQSDIKVKEELVSHLEKSETEFTFMRKKFDEKINNLQSQLAETQKEKDIALMRTKSGLAIKSDIANMRNNANSPVENGKPHTVSEVRQIYEGKMKNLLNEIHDLKRKYSQTTMTMQSTRNQNESLLRTLKVNVETLKVEKKRLTHRMKLEADRVREQLSRQERKIQQLQRQHAKSNQAKKRLEIEHEQQKSTLRKRNEEFQLSSGQLKQMITIIKKAVREGGILDEKLLNKVTPIVGGSFAVIARGGGHGFARRVRKKNSIPLGIRVSRKKQLLDKALCQYIQGKQAVVEMEQLLVRRERLVEEKLELEEERDQVYQVEKEHQEATGQPMDTIAIELMDERVDLISAEILYLTTRVRTLQTEAVEEAMKAEENGATLVKSMSPRPIKHVTFVDEIITEPASCDEWADVDTFEDQFSVPVNAAPELAYEITSKLIKSFEADECKRIIENLVDDIMDLRMSEYNRQVTVRNLEKTVIDLRRTLIVMKRAAISTSVENERRIKHLELNDENMLEMMIHNDDDDSSLIDEYMDNGKTIFDKIYEDGVSGLIHDVPIAPSPIITNLTHTHSTAGGLVSSSLSYQPQISLPNSPVASPPYLINTFASAAAVNNHPPVPTQNVDNVNKHNILSRDLTPSPDRFYNMIQKRLSWQEREDGSETPNFAEINDNPLNHRNTPPDFGHYVTDHDSSTSSIRSSHLRRSSIQSDMSSLSSWNQKTMMRGASSTNEISSSTRNVPNQGSEPLTISPLLSHVNNIGSFPPANDSNKNRSQQQPTTFTSSCQPTRFVKRPLPPLMPSASTFERPTTPTVFDRLAQTPTRASRAKMSYRHSSGSVDDLRRKWESDQKRPSSVMGTNYM